MTMNSVGNGLSINGQSFTRGSAGKNGERRLLLKNRRDAVGAPERDLPDVFFLHAPVNKSPRITAYGVH